MMDTALWTAAVRAEESDRPDRLFDDPFARALAGAKGFSIMTHFSSLSGTDNQFLVTRTRFFDEFLLADRDVRQVVLLGAGMDTRAYRLIWPPDVVLFELDLPETLAAKQRNLANVTPRCDRRAVAADLAADWPTALINVGFDVRKPTVWLAEGLLVYLHARQAESVLATAAAHTGPGSWLGADVVGLSMLAAPFLGTYLDALANAGMPWRFGTDEPEQLLAVCGWQPHLVLQPGEPGAAYRPAVRPVSRREVAEIPRTYFAIGSLHR